MTMPFISSPLVYPTSSSQPFDDSPRKRRKIMPDAPRSPLQTISNNARGDGHPVTLGGFLVDDDSDNGGDESSCDDEHPADALSKGEVSSFTDALPGAVGVFKDVDCVVEPLDLRLPESANSYDAPLPTQDLETPTSLGCARTCSGRALNIYRRRLTKDTFYGDIVAAKSRTETSRAQKDYYGIEIHKLIDAGNAALEAAQAARHVPPTAEPAPVIRDTDPRTQRRTLLWTEKYRARKFTDLIGDERTHRSVLRWFKSWDKIVFPNAAKPKVKSLPKADAFAEEYRHKKILLLTGPPGLGKTTLAHVCARQAGYETKEINASDERSKDVVNGRIRDMVGTENVRGLDSKAAAKAAKPLCIVVDEVDGVVSGNSQFGGEGGFIKALVDLLALDQRNSHDPNSKNAITSTRRKKKGDNFRLLRPLVLICNDVYHPSLRLLRQSPVAEVIHVRKPALQLVIPRMSSIFEKEGIKCDSDGVRTLCEAAWGVTSKKKGGSGTAGGGGVSEGDVRSILVIGEWVAGKLRVARPDVAAQENGRLTRKWVEKHVVGELAHGGGAARSLGRGGSKECVQRVFSYNAGFPLASTANVKKSQVTEDLLGGTSGPTEAAKKATMDRLRGMIEASGEEDRVMTDCFTAYPTAPYQDTTTLTKPCAAHDWLHFSSLVSHRVHNAQEWDLMPYTAYPALAFHALFSATSTNPTPALNADSDASSKSGAGARVDPFATARPDATAAELQRQHTATLTELQTSLTLSLRRTFRSPAALATELVPYALRLLNPAAAPVLVNGQASVRRAQEKERITRAARGAMPACGISFEKLRVDAGAADEAGGRVGPAAASAGWVLRMVPSLDEAGAFETLDEGRAARPGGDAGRARFALRLVLEQAWRAESAKRDAEARARRGGGAAVFVEAAGDDAGKSAPARDGSAGDAPPRPKGVKRDFFGRPIAGATAAGDAVAAVDTLAGKGAAGAAAPTGKARSAVWVTYHEGFSNAVRKPITLRELLDGM